MNDFVHLLEKQKTLESKFVQLSLEGAKYVKKEFGWTMHGLHSLRHLPTLDLYSVLQMGFLSRLRVKGEPLVADYLGPEGHAVYTVQKTLGELRVMYNVEAIEDDPDRIMMFSPHWAGVSGILPGTDCGTSLHKEHFCTKCVFVIRNKKSL